MLASVSRAWSLVAVGREGDVRARRLGRTPAVLSVLQAGVDVAGIYARVDTDLYGHVVAVSWNLGGLVRQDTGMRIRVPLGRVRARVSTMITLVFLSSCSNSTYERHWGFPKQLYDDKMEAGPRVKLLLFWT